MICIKCNTKYLIDNKECSCCGNKCKNKFIAALLQFIFGLGIGRLYIGHKKLGILQLVFGIILLLLTWFSFTVIALLTAGGMGFIEDVLLSISNSLNSSYESIESYLFSILYITSLSTPIYKFVMFIDSIILIAKRDLKI